MQRTRRQILDCIKLKGPMSVDQLGQELGVMPVTVRAHVGILERDHLLQGMERRTGRAGRPSIVYSLTDNAQEMFPNNYDALAMSIINNVHKLHGETSITQLVKKIGEDLAESKADHFRGKDMEGKIREVTEILNEEGSLATWQKDGDRFIVTAHNCPYLHVAEHCSEVCGIELTFLKKALDTDVEIVHSVVDGSSDCAFSIPAG